MGLKIGDKVSYDALYMFKTGLVISVLLPRLKDILNKELDISKCMVDVAIDTDEINQRIFECIYGKKDFVIKTQEELDRILQANFIDRAYERACEEFLGWREELPKIIQKYNK